MRDLDDQEEVSRKALAAGTTSLALVAPWIVIFPGLAICLVVLAANLLGDAARDVLDPKLNRDFP